MVGSERMCGLILAAGRGERLRPLTDSVPKPLLPLNGEKMIDVAVLWLKKAGVRKIIVNGWYRKEMVFDYIRVRCNREGIEASFSPESELMGTGGGILKAVQSTTEEILLVHNSDIICNADPRFFLDKFLQRRHPALLLCVPYVENTTPLWLKGDTIFLREVMGAQPVTYAGISAFRTQMLKELSIRKCDFISGILKPLQKRYGGLGGYLYSGIWCDGGTPEGYRKFRDIWKTLKKAELDEGQ